jgi:hypothetical protein
MPLYILHSHRFETGVDRILILEILVEFAIAAQVVVGAGLENRCGLFEMMQTGAPVGGQFP